MKASLPFILVFLVTSCLAGSLSNVEKDESFDWRLLSRHALLMTPMVDLRVLTSAPAGEDQHMKFFPPAITKQIPQQFKQDFAKLRYDVKVFAAGGAYDYVSGIENLESMAKLAIMKEPLPPESVAILTKGAQNLRYFAFFALTKEKIFYGLDYQFQDDRADDSLSYLSSRTFEVKFAIWDSIENRTVWLGSADLADTASNTVSVPNPSKRRVKIKGKGKDAEYVWKGRKLTFSLAQELSRHKERFPPFPSRDYELKKSYRTFALALPMSEEEAEYVTYRNWTFSRLGVSIAPLRLKADYTALYGIDFTSMIYHHYRLGAGFDRYVTTVRDDGAKYVLNSTTLYLTTMYRLRLTDWWRLLAGLNLGSMVLGAEVREDNFAETKNRKAEYDEWEGTLALRLQSMFGAHSGFQWGVEGSFRLTGEPEEQFFQRLAPPPWTLGLTLAFVGTGI